MSNRLHNFHVKSFRTPTTCDYCYIFLFGLSKQGVKCEYCHKIFHKDCAFKVSQDCDAGLDVVPNSMTTVPGKTAAEVYKPDMEHSMFECRIYKKPYRKCYTCDYGIKNKNDFYFYCADCKISVHRTCLPKTKKDCRQKLDEPKEDDFEKLNQVTEEPNGSNCNDSLDSLTVNKSKCTEENKLNVNDVENKLNAYDNDESSVSLDKVSQIAEFHANNYAKSGNMIKLNRFTQKVRNSADFFWKGNMTYSTSQNPTYSTHFWKLESQIIKVFQTSRMEKQLFEIPLEAIDLIKQNLNNVVTYRTTNILQNNSDYVFLIQTNGFTYYCGLNYSTLRDNAQCFYNMLKMVYLPFVKGNRKSLKISAPNFEDKDINEDYIINTKVLLGSGQFGLVYSGFCRTTNKEVAIKIIDKTGINENQSSLKNEVTILCNLNHPGIVRLFALYDTTDNLYIVTEKMSMAMLEMILSENEKRLNERVSKFLMHQIFIALQYMHQKDIAHCDLKPENILLTIKEKYPQVKICDFGYAKIIGENSFRRSLVGTPAYTPPEVRQRKTFNKSMDLWSVGVVMYVTLSGYYPFVAELDIYEQILNERFNFSVYPWQSISREAIDLISNELMTVSINKRSPISKALKHKWFSEDRQLYDDLCELEARVGEKWLLTKEMIEKWESTDMHSKITSN